MQAYKDVSIEQAQSIASQLFCDYEVDRNYYRAKAVECKSIENGNLEYFVKDEVQNEIVALNRMISELKKYGIAGQILADLEAQLDELENAWFMRQDEVITTASKLIRVIN